MGDVEKKVCNGCIYDSVIEELRRDAERNSEQHREFYQKFNVQATQIAISEERYTNLLSTMNRLEESVNKISDSLDEIKQKPAKRWDALIMTALGCVVTAVVTFMLTTMGM